MPRPMKLFAAFFAGNITFIFLYASACWFISRLGITPYGRFMQAFFKGRSPEEAQAYIDANKPLFDLMMPQAAHFSNMVITPTVGLVAGIVIGLVVSTRDTKTAPVWSFVTIIPVLVVFWFWLSGDPFRGRYLLMLIIAVVGGGFIGNAISTRAPSRAGRRRSVK